MDFLKWDQSGFESLHKHVAMRVQESRTSIGGRNISSHPLLKYFSPSTESQWLLSY